MNNIMKKPIAILYSMYKGTEKPMIGKYYGVDGILEAHQDRESIGDDFDFVALGTDKNHPDYAKAKEKLGDYRIKQIGLK